ncbi:hypothetical protein [Neptuniibacter sp. QD37_11]|uniref:hypothetical protein n=1 Tax=Neptuniibacter sp. QD37_11 TaxID=3398209 RepID=UPI0039F6214D
MSFTIATYPTRPEFDAAVELYRHEMSGLLDMNMKANNPKLKELVARTKFEIKNGYQTLVAHWDEVSLDDVQLPSVLAPRAYLIVDFENGLWLYHGEVSVEKHGLKPSGEHIYCDPEVLRSESNATELKGYDLKVFQKFYQAIWVGCEYHDDMKGGCPDEWSEYGFVHQELRNYGLLDKGKYVEMFAWADSSTARVIGMQLRPEFSKVEVDYTSHWDCGAVETKATLNLLTGQVYGIEVSDAEIDGTHEGDTVYYAGVQLDIQEDVEPEGDNFDQELRELHLNGDVFDTAVDNTELRKQLISQLA